MTPRIAAAMSDDDLFELKEVYMSMYRGTTYMPASETRLSCLGHVEIINNELSKRGLR